LLDSFYRFSHESAMAEHQNRMVKIDKRKNENNNHVKILRETKQESRVDLTSVHNDLRKGDGESMAQKKMGSGTNK